MTVYTTDFDTAEQLSTHNSTDFELNNSALKIATMGLPGGSVAGELGSTPGQRTRSHLQKLRVHMLRLSKMMSAASKTWCSQNKFFF